MLLRKIVPTFAAMLICLLFGAVALTASAANEGAGIVKADTLRLRSEASETSSIIATANKGDNLVIIKWADDTWYEVICAGKRGFMKASYVEPVERAVFDIGEGEITGDGVRFRAKPDMDAKIITRLELGKKVTVTGVSGKWYIVTRGDTTGYVHSDYLRVILNEVSQEDTPLIDTTVTEPKEQTVSAAKSKAYSYTNSAGDIKFDTATTAGKLAVYAMTLLGVDYVYGGASPSTGFDCSGYVMYIFKQYGIDLPHSAGAQMKYGTKVEKSELVCGDIVFFTGHSGIYLGDGVFIHASSGGDCVKLNNLDDNYYKVNYKGARRVL